MKIKSYIYCFVALALVGCDKGATQSPEPTDKSVEMQFSMGTKVAPSDNPTTFRFLAAVYAAGVYTTSSSVNYMAGTYRGLFNNDEVDKYDYLIPCAVNDDGSLTSITAYDSSKGLYPSYNLTYSLTAVSPAVADTKETIQLTSESSAMSVWGVTIPRDPSVGKEIYIATIPTIIIDGPTMGSSYSYTYDFTTPLKEPRATLTLKATAVTETYHINKITYRNVMNKAQYHPKSGFVADYGWYDDVVIFESDPNDVVNTDLDIIKGEQNVVIPYFKDGSNYEEFPLLAMDYGAETQYISAPELIVEFNVYTGDEITATREAKVILSRNFSPQMDYDLELTLKSVVLSVTVSPSTIQDWGSGGSISGNVGADDEFWKGEATLTTSDDWESGADVGTTIK